MVAFACCDRKLNGLPQWIVMRSRNVYAQSKATTQLAEWNDEADNPPVLPWLPGCLSQSPLPRRKMVPSRRCPDSIG